MMNVVRALYLRPNLSTWMAPLKNLITIVIGLILLYNIFKILLLNFHRYQTAYV